jgi:hypothetical protein
MQDILPKVSWKNPTLEIMFRPNIFNKALIILEDECVAMITKTLLQLGLPAPVRDRQDVLHAECIREKNYNVEELSAYVADKRPLLNQDKKSYQFIMNQVAKHQGGIIFLDASGGTGKTFLTNQGSRSNCSCQRFFRNCGDVNGRTEDSPFRN